MAFFQGFTEGDLFFDPDTIPSESFGYRVPDSTLLNSLAPQFAQAPGVPAGPGIPALPTTPSTTGPATSSDFSWPQKRRRLASSFPDYIHSGHVDLHTDRYTRVFPDRVEAVNIPPGLDEQGLHDFTKKHDALWVKRFRQRRRDQDASAVKKAQSVAVSQARTPSERMLAPKPTSVLTSQVHMPPTTTPITHAPAPTAPTMAPQYHNCSSLAGEGLGQDMLPSARSPPGTRPPRHFTPPDQSPLHSHPRPQHPKLSFASASSRLPILMSGPAPPLAGPSAQMSPALQKTYPQLSEKVLRHDGSIVLQLPDNEACCQALANFGLAAGSEVSNVIIRPDNSFQLLISGQLPLGKPSYEQLLHMYGFAAGQDSQHPSHDATGQFDMASTVPQQHCATASTQRLHAPFDSMTVQQRQASYRSYTPSGSGIPANPIRKRGYARDDEDGEQHPSKRVAAAAPRAHSAAASGTLVQPAQAYHQKTFGSAGQDFHELRQTAHFWAEQPLSASQLQQDEQDVLHDDTGSFGFAVTPPTVQAEQPLPAPQLQQDEQDVFHEHPGSSTVTATPQSPSTQLSSCFDGDTASHGQDDTPATQVPSPDDIFPRQNGEQSPSEAVQPERGDDRGTGRSLEQVAGSAADRLSKWQARQPIASTRSCS